jgi:phenylalanyl-tRNA synthetase beta chain
MSGEPLLESVHLFDEYRGTGVPEGWRSLAFRLTYRSDHTLTIDEIEKVHQQVRSQLMDRFSVELRS